jgi:hypothetical protein
MLYKIIIIFITLFSSRQILSKVTSDEFEHCLTQALLTSHHTRGSLEAKKIGQGQAALDKEFRVLMNKSTAAPYVKHTKARTIEEAKELSKGKDGIAQYLPGVHRESLERSALLNKDGFYKHFGEKDKSAKNGTYYKYVHFDKPIGFDGGVETHWLRVEWSSGQYHGHPISNQRIHTQCSECPLLN